MSLDAQSLEADKVSSVRIVLSDTLPGGSEMEVTLEPEQAAAFAVSLHEAAKTARAAQAEALDQGRLGV
jgi:hypothetical protein